MSTAAEDEDELGPLTDDALTGRFRVLQRERGHRYSIDDQLTAFEAIQATPEARRVLDLGSGIGSVALSVAHALPHAAISAIEAQPISFGLLQKNVARNGLDGVVHAALGDLRNEEPLRRIVEERGPFDLVTGTPPYFVPGEATLPPDSQKAHARFELRGGVEAYIAGASRALSSSGTVVLCISVRQRARLGPAAEAAGLHVVAIRDLVPREGKAPLFVLVTLKREHAGPTVVLAPFVARTRDGERTFAERTVRAFFGLVPPPVGAP